MIAASPAMSPAIAMSSFMPRPTPQPLRRVAAALAAAVTVLALLVTSALPARAASGVRTEVTPLTVAAIVPPVDAGRTLHAPAQPLVQVRSPRVPAVCALQISGARRDVTVYPERCLRRVGFDYRLPRHCAYQARIHGRTDRVYAQDCLRNAGFRVDAGRGHDRGHRDFGHDRGRGHDRDFGRGHPRPYY